MSVLIKPLKPSEQQFCVVFSVWRPSDSLSLADLLSCSQFLCGLIRLIRTCGSFHKPQALGAVEGIEASSQDLSALYPAAWNTSQGQPGGLVSEGSQKPPACFHLHLRRSYQGGSPAWRCQRGYKHIKAAGWQTFGEIRNGSRHCRSGGILKLLHSSRTSCH